MPLFHLFFLGLDWPWVGEFVGFIVILYVFPTQQNFCKYLVANTLLLTPRRWYISVHNSGTGITTRCCSHIAINFLFESLDMATLSETLRMNDWQLTDTVHDGVYYNTATWSDFPCSISPQFWRRKCRCQKRSAWEPSRRELSEDLSRGIGTLLVVQQWSLEKTSQGGVTHTVTYIIYIIYYIYGNSCGTVLLRNRGTGLHKILQKKNEKCHQDF